MRFLLFLLIMTSCAQKPFSKEGQVTIIKQWHPSPKTDTRDITLSKSFPQYVNQKDIYDRLEKKVKKNKHLFLLAEGCESQEITSHFDKTFNGWNMETLSKASSQSTYSDILTMLPMKLKAKHQEQVTAICADDEALMEKNQLALSDARGFLGFYLRLRQIKNSPKSFARYKEALEETQKQKINDPITYSKEKALESLQLFKEYVKERNVVFLEHIKKHLDKNPVVVIGGLHARDLSDLLKAENIPVKVITPKGYPEANEKLPQELMKELQK